MLAFRKLDYKVAWTPDREKGEEWLPVGALRADVLKDCRTTKNTLSIYLLDDLSLVPRMIAAFAATGKHLTHFDYVLFDDDLLDNVDCVRDSVAGETIDGEVNHWHENLGQLTAEGVLQLAKQWFQCGDFHRCNIKEVGRSINDALTNGWIREARLAPSIADRLKEPKYERT